MTYSLLASLCLLAFLTVPTSADDQPRTISVTGEGTVSSPPDTATIHTGVETEAATAKEALAANNTAMDKILQTLNKLHVASKDVQTSGFSVSPVYKRDPRGRTLTEIIGYRVQNQLRVEIRDLPNLGTVLDALVDAGSNRVSGISFSVDDATGLLNQARSRAVADAKSRAGIYAQAAGVKVGKVRTITEQSSQMPRPFQRGRFLAAAEASSVPVATGELDFSISVHVVYDLEEK